MTQRTIRPRPPINPKPTDSGFAIGDMPGSSPLTESTAVQLSRIVRTDESNLSMIRTIHKMFVPVSARVWLGNPEYDQGTSAVAGPTPPQLILTALDPALRASLIATKNKIVIDDSQEYVPSQVMEILDGVSRALTPSFRVYTGTTVAGRARYFCADTVLSDRVHWMRFLEREWARGQQKKGAPTLSTPYGVFQPRGDISAEVGESNEDAVSRVYELPDFVEGFVYLIRAGLPEVQFVTETRSDRPDTFNWAHAWLDIINQVSATDPTKVIIVDPGLLASRAVARELVVTDFFNPASDAPRLAENPHRSFPGPQSIGKAMNDLKGAQ